MYTSVLAFKLKKPWNVFNTPKLNKSFRNFSLTDTFSSNISASMKSIGEPLQGKSGRRVTGTPQAPGALSSHLFGGRPCWAAHVVLSMLPKQLPADVCKIFVQKSCKDPKKKCRGQQGAATAELPELWKWGEISVSPLLDSAPQQGMGLTLNLHISGLWLCHCLPDLPSGVSEGTLNLLNSILRLAAPVDLPRLSFQVLDHKWMQAPSDLRRGRVGVAQRVTQPVNRTFCEDLNFAHVV